MSSEIRGGTYQIGDRLPSEAELSLRFCVSRHTVRAALRALHDLGLVSSQQGVGTIVQETRLLTHYSQGFTSAQDLLQYATTTRVRVVERTKVAVDAALASTGGACAPFAGSRRVARYWPAPRSTFRWPSASSCVNPSAAASPSSR